MTPRGWFRGSAAALALLAAAACGDLPSAAPVPDTPGQPAGGLQALTCRASVADHAVTCGSALPGGASGDLIIGGQHQFVDLLSDSVSYDTVTAVFSFTVSVTNLMPQAIGTTDGVTADPGGVKVFFHSLPTVNRGAGTVSVLNADGTGTFTGANQPYYQYAAPLQPNATSAARRWNFSVPATVVSFVFTVYVNAAVPNAAGWVEILPGDTSYVARGATLALVANVHTATGALTYPPVTWNVSNPAVATVNGGTVTGGASFGETLLIATSGSMADTTVLEVGIPPLVQLSAGAVHTCGIDALGHAFCWGQNNNGPLGVASLPSTYTPVKVWQGTARFVRIVSGDRFVCGLTAAGQTWCWGNDQYGELGDGGNGNYATLPVQVHQGAVAYTRITASADHACGLAASGQAYCWGRNPYGELGSSGSSAVPRAVEQSGLSFTEVATGFDHTCALTAAGQASCWGSGQAGLRTHDQNGRVYITLAGGYYGECALTSAHQGYCWGNNSSGEIGVGAPTYTDTPLPMDQRGLGFLDVSLAVQHGCAAAADGEVLCFGFESYGELGFGTSYGVTKTPTSVTQPPGVTFTRVAAGQNHSCAVTSGGDAYCWGLNNFGQLGGGVTDLYRTVPTLVKR